MTHDDAHQKCDTYAQCGGSFVSRANHLKNRSSPAPQSPPQFIIRNGWHNERCTVPEQRVRNGRPCALRGKLKVRDLSYRWYRNTRGSTTSSCMSASWKLADTTRCACRTQSLSPLYAWGVAVVLRIVAKNRAQHTKQFAS